MPSTLQHKPPPGPFMLWAELYFVPAANLPASNLPALCSSAERVPQQGAWGALWAPRPPATAPASQGGESLHSTPPAARGPSWCEQGQSRSQQWVLPSLGLGGTQSTFTLSLLVLLQAGKPVPCLQSLQLN